MIVKLGPQFFRHEYGRLVALLTRRAGVRYVELVEDAVQAALLAAVESWGKTQVPENPSAWLFRVAQNHLAGELRRRARRDEVSEAHENGEIPSTDAAPDVFLPGDVPDSLLRMLFVCCDSAIPVESQLVLALKTLCGFEIREIADRLFSSEASIYKRLERARNRLRNIDVRGEMTLEHLASRLPAVQAILYTLFTEGYLSSHADGAIRRQLCEEALRLATILAEHREGAEPETFALLALMHLHLARLTARQDASGGLLLLEEQDRSLFDQQHISLGLSLLAQSAEGTSFSRYHAEAGIAAEHCLASSLADTRWDRVVECYELLDRLAPSVLHTLNRALAIAELSGPAKGLSLLEGLQPPSWLAGSYIWSAVLADLHGRCGHAELAERHRFSALQLAPSSQIRATLQRRLERDLL